MEYIENDKKNGIKYDYNLIRKEFRKLKIPKSVYNPVNLPLENDKWFITMSERSRGKTTNLLLLGMIFNKLYKTEIQYLRTRDEMITPKNSKDLFSTIIQYGYVEKLTDGNYNTIVYKSRRWFYAFAGENGEIIRKEEKQFCTMLAIEKAEIYKSSYNAPLGDFIIFDEFIEKFYYPQVFLDLMDLIKTIARDRWSVSIFMSANTINKESFFFNELCIRNEIEDLHQGDQKEVVTKFGTRIFIEILGQRKTKEHKKIEKLNSLYYGFENNKLSSITGVETWSVDSYPHPPKNKFSILEKTHYVEYNGKLINLEICIFEENDNIFINCHHATKTYPDSIIYSIDFSLDKRYRFKLGHTKKDFYIWEKYKRNLFTYADNSVGDIIEKFYNHSKKI